MIRAIAAIDSKRGIADAHGIPWHGKIPADTKYFRDKTAHSILLMGYGFYIELEKPLPDRRNVVATTRPEPLRPGFEKVTDARAFLLGATEDVWNGGGAKLYESTLDLIDELYLTQLQGDFGCTKFFPPYDDQFELASQSDPIIENGITYTFNVYRRKT